MTTAASASRKSSVGVTTAGQVHADGAGHHMKTVAMKCRFSISCYIIILYVVSLSKGSNQNSQVRKHNTSFFII